MSFSGRAERRAAGRQNQRPPRFLAGVLGLSFLAAARGAPTAGAAGPSPLVPTEGGPAVEVIEYENADVSPWAEFFAFDSPNHPKIVQLRKQEKLDELLAGAKTDLERAVRLKAWVAGTLQFGRPTPEVFSDWSAVALMEKIKAGQRVWCGQAAMVVQQACIAMGLPARFIELGNRESPACHFTTEVFLREHGKWAVVDCTPLEEFDVYYTVGRVPQSALEMHRHVVDGTMEKVTEVHPDRSHPVKDPKSPAWTFYYVRWLTRCDVVTNTPEFRDMENVFDKRWHTVEWRDDKAVPWERSKHTQWWTRNVRQAAWNTSNPDVVSWKPSKRTKIELRPGPKDRVYVQLWTADLDFGHFEVRIDDRPWERLPEGNVDVWSGLKFGWGPERCSLAATPGTHRVDARAVSRDGTKNPESFVWFRVK